MPFLSSLESLAAHPLRLEPLVAGLGVYVAVCVPFLFASLWLARKQADFAGILVGNACAIGVSFAHEGAIAQTRGVSDVSLGRFVVAFLVYELIYYWNHRLNHRIPFNWYLFHYSHHRSPQFGLYVASISPSFYKIVNYTLKIHLLHLVTGIPLAWAFYIAALNLDFQFFNHAVRLTRVSFGPLEYVLNTPAAHAIHHVRNKDLLDKNFGGVLMLWDHVFGTFVHGPTALAETEVEYGVVVEPLPRPRWWSYVLGGETILWRKLVGRSGEDR